MPKRILINLNTTWNVYNFRLGLIKSLQLKGYEVVVVAPKDEYVSKLELIGVKCHHVSINQKGANPITDLFLFIRYLKIFKKIRPDLILSYTIKPNIYGNLAAKIANIPTINNISGLGTLFIKNTFLSYIGKILYRFSLKSSAHVFFQNNSDHAIFLKSELVSTFNTSVIPGSGVNTGTFQNHKKTNRGEKYLFLGRLIGDKGVFEYLEVAAKIIHRYPTVQFLLAGEIGYNNKTALTEIQLDSYTNSQIKYLGKTDNIVDLLKSVDVIVLPSYREGLSKSLIEAASMSIPIITTDVPGCNDVVEDGYNGLICDVKSIESLEKNVIRMIELPAGKRVEMGINGRKIAVAKFDEKIVIEQYIRVIEREI